MAAVTRVGPGSYRVEHGERQETVYVAGSRGNTWAFWNGESFHERAQTEAVEPGHTVGTVDPVAPVDPVDNVASDRPQGVRTLASPMPATIVKVIGVPGAAFKRGDTLIVVEAMKMELPIVAEHDGVVRAVLCHEGDLVQPGQSLIELE